MGKVDMIRKLILIAGLSLSVGAFGCSSDDNPGGNGGGGAGGDAGAGGMGGDAGAGGAGGTILPTDACTNSADLDLVCADGWLDAVEACAGEAGGDAAGTADCLVENSGISEDCATCYGNDSQCSRDNCAIGVDTSCLPMEFGGDFGPGTPECLACQEAAGCTEALDTCTGAINCSM
jgi:hypothetical protein